MAAHHNVNPEQLKMFMSPNEIHAQYQPLDGDREREHPRSGEITRSPFSSEGESNYPLNNEWSEYRHTGATDKYVESTPDLWDRKLDESYDDGLHQDIYERGVQHPIRLGQERGSEGKPQIVGGHHRLASATETDPNGLVPVLHDESLGSARRSGQTYDKRRVGFPYK